MNRPTDKTTTVKAPALEGGLSILDLLSEHPSGVSFTDIVTELPFSKATVVRILKILADRDYVSKNAFSNGYRLGPKMLRTNLNETRVSLWKEHAIPLLKRCTDELANTCLLFHWNGQYLQSIAKEMHSYSIVMQEVGGISDVLTDSPWGWIVLSDVLDISRKQAEALELKTIENAKFQWQWLTFYRDHHYAYDDANFFAGVRRLAVPILYNGKLIGMLAVGGTRSTLPDHTLEKAAAILKSSADKIAATWPAS